MADRYFVVPPISGDRVKLLGPEARHLSRVMRAKPGDRVVLFDGSGAEFAARVEAIGRAEVELAVLSREEVDRELPLEVTLAAAPAKADRQRWLVEKAVELGVARLLPLETARSMARPGEKTLERLRRWVVEASKQCGRNRLMEIAQPQSWDEFIQTTADRPCRLLAHPKRQTPEKEQSEKGVRNLLPERPLGCFAQKVPDTFFHQDGLPDAVLLAVGPEGGFTPGEVALALDAGWQPIDLGPRILRIETAAILLAAMITQHVPET